MNEFTIIDGELAILRDGEIEYVFERDSFSRAAYNYMIHWIQDKKSPDDDPVTVWIEAEKAWDTLSPEIQGMLVSITNKEKQQASDIRDGLLATFTDTRDLKPSKILTLNVLAHVSVNGDLTLFEMIGNFINLNLTDAFLTHGDYAVPKILHDWKVMCKPFTIAWNFDDDKLLWRTLFVLDEITHLEVHNFQKKLNLR